MTTSTSFAQVANNQSISLSSALRANTPPTKGQTTSRKFLTLSIFLLLSFFTTNAWGADVVYKTAKFGNSYNSVSIQSYSNAWSSTYNGFTVDITNANNNANGWSYIKMGSKNAASTGTITTNAKIDAAITKVTLTIDAITASNITSITLKTATSSNGTYTSVGTFTKAKGAQTVTLASPTANLFYKIEVVCTKGSSNGLIQISQVDYYKSDVVPKYTVTFNAGSGTCDDESLTETSGGAGVTLPTANPSATCQSEGWTFAGWAEASVATETEEAPTTLYEAGDTYKPTSDITLYAVYKRTEGGGGGGSTEEEVIFSEQGYANQQEVSSYDGTNFSVAFNKGTNSNVPKYYTSGTAIRIYGGGYFTVSSDATITKIVLGFGSSDGSNAITTNVNTYSNGTWTGSANSVKFTIGGSTGNRRIASLTVTTSGGGSTTYYHSTPDCGDPCASLQAPNVTATATENSITLSWAAVPDATSYNVYNYTTEDLDETTSLTYTFTGLSSETEYEWGVESAKGECFKETRGTTTTQETCTDAVNVMKGTPSNGSFTMVSGYQSTCNGPVTVTLSNIEPATGYQFSAITQSGVDAAKVTIDNTAKTVTYAKNTTGPSTINVTFTPAAYAINYKDQGGANFSGQHEAGYPQNHTYNTETTLKSASKNHYIFGGWYKESDCSETAVTTLGATDYTNNITLYAKWTAKTYTITLDANGGTFVDNRDSQTKGSATFDYIYGTYATYNDAPNLTNYYTDLKRDGYRFDKWVSAGSPWNKLFTNTGDRTIQAQWSKLYTITLSENGTPTTPTTQTSTSYTLPTELSAGTCQDDTKELVGWSTVAIPNPGDKPNSNFYELGATVTLTADQTTFYAVFATAEGSQNVFKRMQTLDELNNASRIAIINAYSSSAYILNTSLASAATAPKESSGKITVTEGQYWTLEKSNSYWKFKNSDNKYLTTNTIPTSSSKSGSVQLSTSGNNEWVIANNTYTSNGTPVFTIYNASSKNAGLEYSNGWILYYSTDFNTSWFTLKLYIPDVSYSEFTTTCVKLPDPVISFVATPADPIVFDPVNCGSTTSKAQAKTVQVSGANLQEYVSVEVTGPYKIARTSSTNLSDYTTSLTLDKTNTGNINANYSTIYIISCPPAQSTDATTGTLTFTTKKGNTLTVNLSTPTVNCTQYTLTLVDRGVPTEQPTKYYAGETIDEAPAAPEGVCTDPIHYVFDGWAETTVAAGATTYTKVTFPYTVTGNTKFYAVYRYVEDGGADSGDYVKVTENLDDYSGDYLFVNETDDVAFDGGRDNVDYELDATNNTIEVTINGNTIASNATTDAAKFTIAKVDGGYSIKSASGYYIGWGGAKNGLNTNSSYTVNYLNTISNNTICGKTGYLMYNKAADQKRFRYFQSGQEDIALYRKAASYLYTTSPVCGPHLAITDGKDIYVTGGNAGGTRDLVIAQQKVSYKATRLNVGPTSQVPDVKVATNGITVGGVVTTDVKVTIDQTKEQQTDGTYTITGTITVQYQPSANGKQEDIQVQLAVDYNAEARDNFTVHARSLPSEFVIVAKSGDKWYALNGDMNNGSSANPANEQVTLDNNANPTKATYAPCNAIYTFDGVPNTGDRTRVRFQGTDGAWLWAASGTNVGIQNKSLKDTPEGNNKAYNWKLETDDNTTYKFHNDNSSRLLGLSGEKFGMYASGVQEFRILPYEAKCLYNYAPSNLKVSVLKGTTVTLTWDAVAGATKYQYRTDDTNWTDCGTEPTVTINGLTGETKYTYYVRAYHEDDGVSQECIDYAVITFTTADCDDVPTDITYTADFNSITVSWTAAAPTATIKYNIKEDGTGGGGTINNATSPYTISGGLNPNTTYYIQILADGTCASPIIPVKTKNVEVDIVEWKTDGIVVDVNTNEKISVSLENEVSYGSGIGTEATELFFSKYYEASYNVKLVAIYNGTKNIIDLTDYTIQYGKTSWESNYITLKDFGATKGKIQPGEEIILYSMQDGNQDSKIMNCVHEDFPDGNWVRVTSSNNDGKGSLSFAGDKTIILCKTEYDDEEDEYYDNIIDVIGALKNDPNEGILPTNTATKEPSWGDDKGWVCETGLSIADDSQIGISTNRCLLIRNNTVTSGNNAVASNMNDFVTLCTEWKGAHVPDNNIDNGVQASCDNFAYVGTFDYSDYYTKYVSMGDDQVFEENKRNPDGTVTISIPELSKQSCRNIRIIIKDNNTKVISNQEYKVPIMITSTQGTDGQAFLALQENLATVEVDNEGNPTGNKTNLTLEQVREICKTCDVVVRDNATLMKMADDAANDHPQVRNIYVYENSSLIVPNGTNYTINNLSLRRKGDEVSSLSAYPDALKMPESAATPISLDLRVDANNWHWFTLPFDCLIEDVTWVDGSDAQYNVDWFLMTYDGEQRANTQSGGCWKQYNGTTIEAGKGYIVGITGDLTNPNYTFELRFPMAKEVLVNEGIDKMVDVRAWGVETNIRPNHKGWNLVGNPYLEYYQRDNITNFEGLRLGKLTGPDSQTGYWEQTGDVPYVVIPIEGGWVSYEQVLASETDLMPFTAYFVQVGNDEKHNSSDELSISFDHTKLQLSATPMPASIVRRAPAEIEETEEPIIVGVSLTNSKGESDKTSLVIDDRFTNEYEMNGDFFKWFGDYYNYYTKPVLYTIGADQGKRAFNALNEELAKQPIPMGMYAAQAGNYTFSLNQQFDLSRVEEVWLYDATQSTYTNLMQSDYTFSTSKVNGAGRFSLSVKLAPKVATSIDNVTADKVWATTHTKQVIVNGLENGMHLWLYDATGKLLYNEPTSNYQHTYLVPQTGTYFVSVMNGNQKQTIKVVVE